MGMLLLDAVRLTVYDYVAGCFNHAAGFSPLFTL